MIDECPRAEVLVEFVSGQLVAADGDRLETHVDRCGACRTALSALARDRSSVGGPGRYRVLEPLGAGAMGAVFIAHDPDLDRRVAIKILRDAGGSTSPERRRRILREARILARLDHPNLVRVLDVGRDDASETWIAMELIDGGNLRQWLATVRSTDQILDAFVAAGRGLAAAHAAGIVHRDVKPENLLVASDGRVVVGDFGLAAIADDGGDRSQLTASGAVLGTPGYMAPEQQAGGTASAQSDQFAWCLALWEALGGQRPFAAEPGARILLIARGDLPPLPRSLHAVAAVLRRGLAADPAARYPSIDALLDALAVARRRRRPRWSRRRIAVAGALVAVGIAIAVVATLARGDASPRTIEVVTGVERGPGQGSAPGSALDRDHWRVTRWRTVQTIRGRDKRTAELEIAAPVWRILWAANPVGSLPSLAHFSIWISTPAARPVQAALIDGHLGGGGTAVRGPGRFTLDLLVASVEYTVTIEVPDDAVP